ncbi:MAG: hypothetical protein ACREYC_13785, partial [Gammaproteobacteria bacterium]
MSSLATSDVPPGDDGRGEPTRWTIHDERLIDDTRRLRLSLWSWSSTLRQVNPDGNHAIGCRRAFNHQRTV